MREWLKNLRTEHGYSMKEMGQKLGISESYYCSIENGDRQKNMDLLLASGLSVVFCIPVTQIIANENKWKEAQKPSN